MPIIIPTVIISFFLDCIISSIVSMTGIFLPLCTIVSLVIIYPYFKKDDISYYKWAMCIGFFYDIAYTDTLLLNACIFFIIAFLIKTLNFFLTNNTLNTIVMTTSSIIVYRVLTYLVLWIIDYISPNFIILLKSIYSSLIINIVYSIIIFIITNYLSKKYRIRKAE